MKYSSIIAAVIRLVFTFQGQAAGPVTPTDVDGTFIIPSYFPPNLVN